MSTCNLEEIKQLIRSGAYGVTGIALNTALQDFNYTESDIVPSVLSLEYTYFYKTMASEKIPGLNQDVYKMPISAGKQ